MTPSEVVITSPWFIGYKKIPAIPASIDNDSLRVGRGHWRFWDAHAGSHFLRWDLQNWLLSHSPAPKIWAPMGLNKDHDQKNVLKCHEQSLKRPTDNDSCVPGRNISTVGRVDKPTIVRGPQQRPVFLAFGYQRWPGNSPAANRTCWLSMIIHYAWTHVLGLNCPISTNTHLLLGCVDWIWFCPILMTVDFIPAPSFNIYRSSHW